MSNLEKAKLYIVKGPLDQTIDQQKLKDTMTDQNLGIEVQFNPLTLKVSLANSLKENEQDTANTASQYIGNSSSNLSVEFIFDTSDTYRISPKEGSEQAAAKPKDVRDYVKKIATNFMTPAAMEDNNAVPQRCLFAWGTFLFTGLMESLEETLDFFSPEGTPLRATVAIKLSESRFQFINKEAEAQKKETPTHAGASESTTQANQDAGKDEKEWRDTAMYNGVESPREPAPQGLSVPSSTATEKLKSQAAPNIGGGAKGGFGAGLGAGFSAGAGGGLSLSGGISGGLSGGLSGGISGGLSAGASGGFNGSVGGNVGGSISGGGGGGFSASFSDSLGGGLSTSASITPPAFSFGSSSSLGTNIPGAFSADFKKGGGLSAGGLISGGTVLRDGQSHASSSVSSANGNAQASASASSSNGSFTAQASASVGFD
jgi:hypothetical protein